MQKSLVKTLITSLVLLAGLTLGLEAIAKDYLLAATRPNQLYLVDVGARKVEQTYTIPGEGLPSMIATADDGKIAYVTTNRWESVSGIDLETGKEVFRANMSEPGIRIKSMFAMNVSRDGKELYVHQIPVKLKPDQFEVMDTRIAVYDTADGLDAKPKRVFPAPRRIALLFPGMERKRLYAVGWDLYAFDAESGKIENTYGIRNWQRPDLSEPDVLDVWLLYEQANVFSTPYYTMRTDMSPEDPAAYKTGLMTFDLADETVKFQDFENTEVVIFSSVINPVKRDEAFMVYTQLTKVDLEKAKVVKRIDLDHTYYAINISSDGKEVYLGGAMDNIAVYDTATLEQLGNIELPGGADQSIATIRMVQR